MTTAPKPATTIKAGVCMHCGALYGWESAPYDGPDLCVCQCPDCGAGGEYGPCDACAERARRTVTQAFTQTIIRQIGYAADLYVQDMADGRSLRDLYEHSLFLEELEDQNSNAWELLATALDHVDWGHVAEETVEAYMAHHSTRED